MTKQFRNKVMSPDDYKKMKTTKKKNAKMS